MLAQNRVTASCITSHSEILGSKGNKGFLFNDIEEFLVTVRIQGAEKTGLHQQLSPILQKARIPLRMVLVRWTREDP